MRLVAISARGGIRLMGDDSGSWEVKSALLEHDVRAVTGQGSTMFVGTQGRGVFKSIDWGETWKSAGMEGEIVKSIAASGDQIYAGTKPPRVFVSSDGGQQWQESGSFHDIPGRRLWWSPAELPGTAYVQSLAISPADRNVVVAGIELGAVVRSTDGGATWSRHLKETLRDCHTLKFHYSDGNWVYEAGGSGGGASVSQDGGSTWKKAKRGLDRNYAVACAADPDSPDTWYISVSPSPMKAHSLGNAQAAIFRTQAGQPWIRLKGGLPQPLDSMPYGLATISAHPGTVFATLKNGELWMSEDYGESWAALEVNLGALHLGLEALD